ncbi:hypothetical protein L484_019536 [Morus notabilis]|uniref:Uncharacterized protein n=1 Tax=Morus notabilis TaxID=981085 RepID=W9RBS5_9ROSA|nr:hypothetical protein L484_019536 [Morus notabilis]
MNESNRSTPPCTTSSITTSMVTSADKRIPQALREEPKTRATRAAKKAERNDGEIAAAGEAGLGAGDSAAWVAPMMERTVKITAARATTEACERAIAECRFLLLLPLRLGF